MKKVISILIVFLMVLGFASCGNGGETQTTEDPQAAAAYEKSVCNKIVITYRPDAMYPYSDTEMIDISPDTKTELCEAMEKYIRICKMYLNSGFPIYIEWSEFENADEITKMQTKFTSASLYHYDWDICELTRLRFDITKLSLSELNYYEPLYDMLYELAQSDDVLKIYIGESCPYIPVSM